MNLLQSFPTPLRRSTAPLSPALSAFGNANGIPRPGACGFGLAGAIQPKVRLRPFGFSLVEVAVSMGVLSVSCVGLLGLLASCFDQFRGTIDRSCVTAIAQNLVNQAQQADLDALQAAGPALRYFDDQARETQAGASSSVYRARLRVTTSASYPDNAPANPDLSRITVQVTSNHGPLPQTGAGGLWQDAPARRVLTEVALLGPQR